jgi:hypothetical protein
LENFILRHSIIFLKEEFFDDAYRRLGFCWHAPAHRTENRAAAPITGHSIIFVTLFQGFLAYGEILIRAA